ncbi:hypothetical protein NECAME_17766, partial [Necator americanus]
MHLPQLRTMSNNVTTLITDIVLLVLQFSVIVLNGFIVFIFIKVRSLRQNNALRLLFFLVTTDFLHALTTLPYTIYMTADWNPLQ